MEWTPNKVFYGHPVSPTDYYKMRRDNDLAKPGIGGAPTRVTIIPKEDAARKAHPIARGFLDYFPDAIAMISHLSFVSNEKHNPGEPLHWARGKSQDEPDTMMRHYMARGTMDSDGFLHDVKVAWRALAALQKELERRVAAGEPVCTTKYYLNDVTNTQAGIVTPSISG